MSVYAKSSGVDPIVINISSPVHVILYAMEAASAQACASVSSVSATPIATSKGNAFVRSFSQVTTEKRN